MSTYRETIYRGRDNEIPLALEQGGRVIDASGITRCQLVFKRQGSQNVTIDSRQAGARFDFTQKEAVRGKRVGIIVLKLGEIAAAELPDGLYAVDVYVFDARADDGIYWDTIEVLVRDGDA